ncbi:Formate dehydrogenase [Colletotrichum musicola]|uniref:Formate dehydrogenase n=1 Tax=Colletotrichum musicola TaxID=2175873 RepID=A0A8H6KTR7_9PEZI|nr:Formate dehydrogenase [Colletotrichum musicola]
MVFLSRNIRSIAPSVSRGLHTSSKASFLARPTLSRAAGVSSASSALPRKLPGQLSSIRTLTTTPHNKVKVLAVLYDGGQHAKDVSAHSLPICPSQPCAAALRPTMPQPHHQTSQ